MPQVKNLVNVTTAWLEVDLIIAGALISAPLHPIHQKKCEGLDSYANRTNAPVVTPPSIITFFEEFQQDCSSPVCRNDFRLPHNKILFRSQRVGTSHVHLDLSPLVGGASMRQ